MIFAKGYLFPPSFLELLETFSKPVERDALNMAIHRYMFRGEKPEFTSMNLKRTWIGIFPYLKKSRDMALLKDEESQDQVKTKSRPSQDQVKTKSGQGQDIKDKGIRSNNIPPIIPQGGGSAGFEKFWQAYPKSRRVGKQKAIKAFDRAIKSKITTLDAILSKLEQLKKSIQWTKDNGAYIPHPTTWLNRGGWDDEVELDEQEKPRKAITDIKQCPKCGSFDIKRKYDYGFCNYCGCGFHWNYKAEKWEEEK